MTEMTEDQRIEEEVNRIFEESRRALDLVQILLLDHLLSVKHANDNDNEIGKHYEPTRTAD